MTQFNASEHLIQLKSKEGSKDYLPVQFRLVWFREACPQGTIETQEICVDLDREVEAETYVWNNEKRRNEKVVKRAKGYARFRAIVTDGFGAVATGTKSENAASFPDYIEKCETGAVGRALAMLGFGTQFVGDEMSEGERLADAPVERTPRPASRPAPVTDEPEPEDRAVSSGIKDVRTRLNTLYAEGRRKRLFDGTNDFAAYVSRCLVCDVSQQDLVKCSHEDLIHVGKLIASETEPAEAVA